MAKPRVPFDEFVRKLDRVDLIDFARLAAYIDGEGHIGISVSPPRGRGIAVRHYLVMTVTNTDLRLMNWITSTFGGTCCRANKNYLKPKTKPCYRWCICEIQSEEVIRRCLPYFIIKAEQARLGLLFRALINESRGKRGSPVEADAIERREELRQKVVYLNSAKGFGVVKTGLDRHKTAS